MEKETRLEAILPDTTFLCGQIEMKAEELKQLQRDSEAAGEGAEDDPLDLRLAGEIFVLQQVRKNEEKMHGKCQPSHLAVFLSDAENL